MNDYKVVYQLNQTPSKILMLSLLLSFEAHKEDLLKIMNKAHVTKNIIIDHFEGVVVNITTINCLGFSNEKLPAKGQAYNRALHIYMKCLDNILSRVLINTELCTYL